MTDREDNKSRPTHRVSFAAIRGQDRDGKDILGPAREIGTIWPRRDKDGDGILRFDHIPEELRSRGGGVLFVRKIDALRGERDNKKRNDPNRGHATDRHRDRDDRR